MRREPAGKRCGRWRAVGLADAGKADPFFLMPALTIAKIGFGRINAGLNESSRIGDVDLARVTRVTYSPCLTMMFEEVWRC